MLKTCDGAGEVSDRKTVDIVIARTLFFLLLAITRLMEHSAGGNDLVKECLTENLYECCIWVFLFHLDCHFYVPFSLMDMLSSQ